ncbi:MULTISPECIES: hypothetical protein [unclassified Carboxylicivirga]|uniref:hypothetical protein n=1 Tax=Carboxylicivirga TaxID=1628153 RepID=UPI003D34AEB1
MKKKSLKPSLIIKGDDSTHDFEQLMAENEVRLKALKKLLNKLNEKKNPPRSTE